MGCGSSHLDARIQKRSFVCGGGAFAPDHAQARKPKKVFTWQDGFRRLGQLLTSDVSHRASPSKTTGVAELHGQQLNVARNPKRRGNAALIVLPKLFMSGEE
jgi:hypothetical protein